MQPLDLKDLFQEMLRYRDRTPNISSLGPWLQEQIATSSFPCLTHIPFATDTYTRNRIAREFSKQAGFEALIMRWDKQAKTSIHGHPTFSFYHVISGVFEMELFAYDPENRLRLKEIKHLYPSETTWFLGQIGRYDNFIHRVTCLKPGCTFHVYSEDAQQGIVLL